MRIAFLPSGTTANAAYRSLGPMGALVERGHEVRRLELDEIDTWPRLLRWCQVLHIHRVCDGGSIELARAAQAAGAAVVWDDDDDVTRVPVGTRDHAEVRGVKGERKRAARKRLLASVDLVTTPSAYLAETLLAAGAPAAHVIENYIVDGFAKSVDGGTPDVLRIGWVAAEEHRLDLDHLAILPALDRLLATHPHVRVKTVGIKLPLRSDRYEHVPFVSLAELPSHVATFTIGIAPLSPALAINYARSSIKVKEYAAFGVPWLASPIGPYARLGERQGGRLVRDDDWFEQMDALVRNQRARRKLARRADRWGREQLLSRNAGYWERELAWAIDARASVDDVRARRTP